MRESYQKLLVPFSPLPSSFSVEARLSFGQDGIGANWKMHLPGTTKCTIFGHHASLASRKSFLWNSRVFEVFLKPLAEQGYYEIHLTPTLEWNIFWLENYRAELKENNDFSLENVSFKEDHESKEASFFLRGDSAKIAKFAQALIWTKEEQKSYFAYSFPSGILDFHDENAWSTRKSFLKNTID